MKANLTSKIKEAMKSKINADRFLAISAIFISVSALVVSVIELRMADRHQRLSVLPLVSVGGSFGSKGLAIRLRNGGVGPATIQCGKVTFRGKVCKNWDDLLAPFKAEWKNLDKANINSSIIPAGEVREVLFLSPSPMADSLTKYIQELKIELCYSSLYGETWCVKGDFLPSSHNTPQPAEACNISDTERFEY